MSIRIRNRGHDVAVHRLVFRVLDHLRERVELACALEHAALVRASARVVVRRRIEMVHPHRHVPVRFGKLVVRTPAGHASDQLVVFVRVDQRGQNVEKTHRLERGGAHERLTLNDQQTNLLPALVVRAVEGSQDRLVRVL